MKKNVFILFSILIGLFFSSFTSQKGVVRVTKINGEELYVCDITKVTDTVVFYLSNLVKSLNTIKLESKKEALLGDRPITVMGDNYIGSTSSGQPLKLFDRKGNYISNIGGIGHGPGEYIAIGNFQIDEKSGKIYILPWRGNKLFKYKINGEFESSINLITFISKGKFQVKDNVITAFLLPFQDLKYVVFSQDMEGNIIDAIPNAAHLQVGRDYDGEIAANFNTDKYSFYFCGASPRQDTLYHYEPSESKLIPRFTIEFPNPKQIPYHIYYEFPDYYIACFNISGEIKSIIISKKDKTAFYARVEDDMLLKGNRLDWYYPEYFKNKKYLWSCSSYEFIEKAKKTLARNDLSEEIRKKLTNILEGLDENDNNILIWGEMK